jgi:hypothetical protein
MVKIFIIFLVNITPKNKLLTKTNKNTSILHQIHQKHHFSQVMKFPKVFAKVKNGHL